MKQFKDLEFKEHPSGLGGEAATMEFDNGYGVSVITGVMWYSRGPGSYEVAVTHGGSLTYDTPITDDVIGYQSESQVSKIMEQVQNLPT